MANEAPVKRDLFSKRYRSKDPARPGEQLAYPLIHGVDEPADIVVVKLGDAVCLPEHVGELAAGARPTSNRFIDISPCHRAIMLI